MCINKSATTQDLLEQQLLKNGQFKLIFLYKKLRLYKLLFSKTKRCNIWIMRGKCIV